MKPIYNFKINDSKVKNIFWYILLLYHTVTKCKKINFFYLASAPDYCTDTCMTL